MGDDALDVALAISTWMFEHPILTGLLFALALAAAGAGGFWYENRRGDR